MEIIEGFCTHSMVEVLYYNDLDNNFYYLNIHENEIPIEKSKNTHLSNVIEQINSILDIGIIDYNSINECLKNYSDKLELITLDHPIFEKNSNAIKAFVRQHKINGLLS